MKLASLTVITLLVSGLALGNRSVFKKTALEAQVGNGSADVSSYNKKLDKEAVVEQGLNQLKAERWEGCGPWKVIRDRRPALKLIAEIENMQDDTNVTKNLQALYDNDEILAIVGNTSNNEVECSLSWFNVYGVDGSVLELRYNMGD